MSAIALDRPRSIDTLIASRRPGIGLDGEFYRRPEIFDLEVDRIFMRHWLLAGHISRIPTPGDYFLYAVGGESIVIIRGPDGGIHALFNVCRHRGSRICAEESGNARKLVCPYHNWVYATDGTLLSARHMADGFDTSQFGLLRCHVRVLAGLIFVNLAKEPGDFEPMAHDLGPFLEPHGLDHAKICCRTRYEVKANWKIVAENSWECYHCATAHPEFGAVMSYVGATDSQKLAEERATFAEQWTAYAESLGHQTGGVKMASDSWYGCNRVPIRPGFLTQSRDGQPVAPLMGSLRAYDGGISAFAFRPFTFFVASCDHVMISRFAPVAPMLTDAELIWLVREDAVEGRNFDLKRVTWLWQVTTEQDVRLCENNQAGVNSRRYQPGPYSETEGEVEEFIQWYLRQIG
jgi:phenylpropionate dioxygenase-like ring-hydroxylating dioxygenase large terminal subunit